MIRGFHPLFSAPQKRQIATKPFFSFISMHINAIQQNSHIFRLSNPAPKSCVVTSNFQVAGKGFPGLASHTEKWNTQ